MAINLVNNKILFIETYVNLIKHSRVRALDWKYATAIDRHRV